jgi:hypothetical protein
MKTLLERHENAERYKITMPIAINKENESKNAKIFIYFTLFASLISFHKNG